MLFVFLVVLQLLTLHYLSLKITLFCLQVFKDELEGLIQDQLTKGNTPTGLLALRQIADLVMASTLGGAGPLTSPISEWQTGLVIVCEYLPSDLIIIQHVCSAHAG